MPIGYARERPGGMWAETTYLPETDQAPVTITFIALPGVENGARR